MMRLLRGGVSLAISLLIFLTPAWGQESKGVGVVTALTGQADLKRPQAPQAPLKLRDNLFVRDVVDTHKESLARVLLLGKSSVTVRELSRLEIRQETRPDGTQRAIIDLAAGKIRVIVARGLMKPGDEVQIRTPNAVVAVRGSDGIIEAATLPDGRPQTSVLVASGKFEMTTPNTRPIAMAETMSDVPAGIRLAQAGGPITLGPSQLSTVTGPPGLQQVVTRFVTSTELNAAIQIFKVPGGVASGTGVGKSEPNGEAVLATMEALTQIETLRTGEQPTQGTGTPAPSTTTGETAPTQSDVLTPTTTVTTTTTTTTTTETTTGSTLPPSPTDEEGAFAQLSPGNQRIALALYNAQVSGGSSLTLNHIAEMKLTLGWGEIFRWMKSQKLIKEEKKNLGQVVSQDGLTGSNVTLSGVFNVLDFVNSDTNGNLGLGLGRLCAHGACRQGLGPGSACAGGACAGGPPGGPPGGGPPCGTPPCGKP